MRSAAVIVFIALIASAALYCAQRKTIARGSALANTLLQSNPTLRAMTCDDNVPIDRDGARFGCKLEFKNGDVEDYSFAMNREGSIKVLDRGPIQSAPRIKTTSDPWGE